MHADVLTSIPEMGDGLRVDAKILRITLAKVFWGAIAHAAAARKVHSKGRIVPECGPVHMWCPVQIYQVFQTSRPVSQTLAFGTPAWHMPLHLAQYTANAGLQQCPACCTGDTLCNGAKRLPSSMLPGDEQSLAIVLASNDVLQHAKVQLLRTRARSKVIELNARSMKSTARMHAASA